MGQIGIRELKQNASAVVARAAAGESITITDRGRPAARLTPLEASTLERLYASGQASAPRHPLMDFEWPGQDGDLTATLRAMRDEDAR